MTKEEYKKSKIYYLAIPSVVLLLSIQLYSFIVGLHVGFNDLDWILGIGLFVVLFMVQLIGNDLSWEDDWMFYLGWLFTYVVEITATTWTLYSILEFPNEYVRWVFSGGLAVIASVLPDRLIYLHMKNKIVRSKKVDTVSTHKPVQKYTPAQKYAPKQDKKPVFDFTKSGKNNSSGKPNDHRNIMSLMKNSNSLPTYRPLNSRFDESE